MFLLQAMFQYLGMIADYIEEKYLKTKIYFEVTNDKTIAEAELSLDNWGVGLSYWHQIIGIVASWLAPVKDC